VADSRDVAFKHTEGLSPPQQVQMTLFALFTLLDARDEYQTRCRGVIRKRLEALLEGTGLPIVEDPLRAGYYADLDLAAWGRQAFGEEFAEYIEAHPDPLEIVMALAQRRGTVLLTGSGFAGPPWSARISLANLDAKDYALIGRDLREIAEKAFKAWAESRRDGGGPGHDPSEAGGGSGKEKVKVRPRRHRR